MEAIERKMYRVMRKVGYPRDRIIGAHTIDDFRMDWIDRTLFTFYFEKEFAKPLKEEVKADFTIDKILRDFREQVA